MVSSDLTDYEIIQKIKENPDNFGLIIDRYEQKLYKYIMRSTDITNEEADDLLQEIFIKVYKNIFEVKENLSFSSWIYRIAHNYIIDYFRKNSKIEKVSLDDESYSFLINNIKSDFDPRLDLDKKEIKEIVQLALSKIKKEYREILILKFIEDKSYDEISDILRIPTGTVGTLINRAKAQIKENLNFNF
ncbi:RNA polymerase sigma factor [Candidatus Gracilibacteria bacterium]|jgi:RNA polymerase sigma-70 factor (ECF subfamily)|nr:RNA polymerase sigma factor [Candidatus Gracilibacteria bacterium]